MLKFILLVSILASTNALAGDFTWTVAFSKLGEEKVTSNTYDDKAAKIPIGGYDCGVSPTKPSHKLFPEEMRTVWCKTTTGKGFTFAVAAMANCTQDPAVKYYASGHVAQGQMMVGDGEANIWLVTVECKKP